MESLKNKIPLKRTVILIGLSLFLAGPANAGPCDISCSEVSGIIVMSPDGALEYTITIACCGTGPVAGALVEIEFGANAAELIAWPPPEVDPRLFTGITDVNGEVTFHIAGSGCVDADHFDPGSFIAQIRVDGIVIAEPGVATSPDVVNSAGELPIYRSICEDGFTSAGLSDGVFHTTPIRLGLVEPCSKFTGFPGDPVNLADAVIITRYIKQGIGTACTGN